MAYNEKAGRRQNEWDKQHYKKIGIKVSLEVFEMMKRCGRYENNNQFLNMLIREEIEKERNKVKLDQK